MNPIWQHAQLESIFLSHPAFGSRARPLLTPSPVYGPPTLPQRCSWYILIRVATSATNHTTIRGHPMLSLVGIFFVASESPRVAPV